MQREPIAERPDWRERVEAVGFHFHTMDGEPYWVEDACYRFSEAEIEGLETATAELHRLSLAAVEHVIASRLYGRLGIPERFVPYIETTWRRADPEVYGRFDLRYDGRTPPKLLEYNADTPTSLLETAVVQWYWLKERMPDADQFNAVHERLIDAWRDVALRLPPGATVHCACDGESDEDVCNTAYMRETCAQAGLAADLLDVSEIGWDGRRFTDLDERPIQALFKLYPWEWLVRDEFAAHIPTDRTLFIEPAWKMILSNKGILPILWRLFPGHPNLLPAYFAPGPLGGSYVKKPLLGREGANVTVVAPGAEAASDGPYGAEGYVYQAYCPLPVFDGRHAVVGSWVIAGAPAGIGMREDRAPITRNRSRFLPHYIG